MKKTVGVSPKVNSDLTAKARIRNAAFALYANYGEDATSMRAIAEAAGVTVGLVAVSYTHLTLPTILLV